MSIGPLFRLWCILLSSTLIGVAICIYWLDVPVALVFVGNIGLAADLGRGLGSALLVTAQTAVISIIAIVRLTKGKLPPFAKDVFVACCASLSAFAANDYGLKYLFGRLDPSDYFQNTPERVFHLFQGTQDSSFPSGHMVMAAAFAIAMIRLQPRTSPCLIILLCLGAAALIVGDWHFLSDVIAGAFIGGSAGLVAGELWAEHEYRAKN